MQDLPGKAPDERDELVKVLRADPAKSRATHDDNKSEYILLPLDGRVHLPASGKEAVLHNPHGGKELQRHRKQNCKRVEELHGLCKSRGSVEIYDDDGVDVRSECEIGERTGAAKKDLTNVLLNNLRRDSENSQMRKIMTPESSIGNLCGSRMESVMGITYIKVFKRHPKKTGRSSIPSLCLRRRTPQFCW